MAIPEGLRVALNEIRETSIEDNTLFAKYVPEITPDTDIGSYAASIVADQTIANEFIDRLVKRIVYTQVETKTFKNKLKMLEGDRIPLGAIGQEIYINPAKGRRFNVDDFAGLLAKYESDIKVQYPAVNSDIQYPVTVTRAKLKNAFTSWTNLADFISGISNSLYNGAYIDSYKLTKSLVSNAYKTNSVQIQTVSAVTTTAAAEDFVEIARSKFLDFQEPTSRNNAWSKVGGYGREVITWSNPEDIVFIIRNDISSKLDIQVMAKAFNIDSAKLLGQIITTDSFDEYDENGNKIYDGSNILGIMADKSWFRIKEQDFEMDEFYNANNRTWQMYLNVVKMYQFSLFSNACVIATAVPEVAPTSMTMPATATVKEGKTIEIPVVTNPAQANKTIVYTSSADAKATVAAKEGNNKVAVVTGVDAGEVTITATCGTVTATTTVTVTE